MAQTNGATPCDIVDLTKDDEQTNDLETLSSAASRVQAAASQLTNHLESFTPQSRPRPTLYTYDDTVERIWDLPGVRGNAINGISKNKRATAPIPEPRIQTLASRPSPVRPRTPNTAPDNKGNSITPSRRPRAAAIDASRLIARDYDILNPLEEQQQVTVNTPKKPGRPRKDEWIPTKHYTPKSGSDWGPGNKYEETGLPNEDSPSPRPQIHDSQIANGHSDEQFKVTLKPPAKRKRSSPLLELGSSKLPRTEGLQNGDHKFTGELLDKQSQSHYTPEEPSMQLIRDCQEPNQAGNQRPPSASPPAASRPNTDRVSAAQYGFNTTPSDIAVLTEVFSTVVYPAIKKAKKRHRGTLTDDELISIGKSVSPISISDPINRDHEGKQLNGRQVAIDVVKKDLTPVVAQRLSLSDDNQRKRIKRFVKKEFNQKVTQATFALESAPSASAINSDKSSIPVVQREEGVIKVSAERRSPTATEVNDKRPEVVNLANAARITNLAGYLSKLENETLGLDSLDSEQISGLVQENAPKPAGRSRTSWAQQPPSAADTTPLTAAPPSIAPTAMASIAKASPRPEFASDEPLPTGFDRGRYPMQRRRRGNKFYTPERKQKTPKLENTKAPLAESLMLRQNPVAVKPSKLSRPARIQKVPQSPESESVDRELTQLLAKRANHDQNLNILLKITASGKATKSQTAELKDYIDKIRATLTSSKENPMNHAPTSLGLSRAMSGTTEATLSLMSVEGSALPLPDKSSNSITGRLTSSEKDQERPSKALAQWPENSGIHKNEREVQTGGKRLISEARNSSFTNQAPLDSNFDLTVPAAPRSSLPTDGVFPGAHTPRNSHHMKSPDLGVIDTSAQRGSETLQMMASSAIALPARDQPPTREPLSTALDPHLERLVAALIPNVDHTRPYAKSNRYHITYDEQEDLVDDPNLIKHVDISLGKLVRIETQIVDQAKRPLRSSSSLLRHRELGSDTRGRHVNTQNELRLRNAETIMPWRSWKGASGDIVAAAWAPDSTTYAVGAAAHTNVEDLQYNRPCNLLLGELTSNALTELPDHRVARPKPETIPSGPNATQAVYDACDPNVYETVTSIAFAPIGTRMYTASHDRTVKIWDTALRSCQATLRHDAWVTSIEASTQIPGLFATATKKTQNAIRVYYSQSSDDALVHSHFSSSRAELRPDWQIYPECLRWGPTPYTSHLLLAGFYQWSDDSGGSGQIVLWDAHAFQGVKVSPSSQSVYAAAWHPHSSLFATGGAPSGVVTDRQSTKSVVRTWDLRTTKRYTMEYECNALDMQDVTFSPMDSNIVTAGCTDGISYIWDFRRPDRPLHRLRHGKPIIDLDHTRDREQADTGVMMSLWGLGGTLFYTGSSDGMVKAWDIRRHPADVLIRNVAQFEAGVQSGAFSPDGTNLLVGDADGGFHILSSAPCGPRDPKYEGTEGPINLVRAQDGSGLKLEGDDDDPGTEGRETGRELIESGQLDLHPEFGVTRGQYYHGPYARDSRKPGSEPNKIGRLLPEYAKLQAFSREGEERPDIAEQRRGLIRARKLLIDEELNKHSSKSTAGQIIREEDHLTPLARSDSDPSHSPLEPSQRAQPFGRATFTGHGQDFLDPTVSNRATDHERDDPVNEAKINRAPTPKTVFGAKNNMIPENRMVEENYWWPRLGEDEIAKAKEKARHGRG